MVGAAGALGVPAVGELADTAGFDGVTAVCGSAGHDVVEPG